MTWLIDAIKGLPIAVKVIAYTLLAVWSIEMFLFPFNVSRLVNRLADIKNLLVKIIDENKINSEALGNKFDVANLVMSDFWKYKHVKEEKKEPPDAE